MFKKVKPKKLNGQFLNGSMIVELAKAYVDTLNTGRMPTIESAWDYMCEEENQKAVKGSLYIIKTESDKIIENFPMNSSDLLVYKENVGQIAEENFKNNIISGMSDETLKEFIGKIKAYLEDTFKDLQKQNDSMSIEIVKKYFEGSFKNEVRQALRNDKYHTYEDYEKDLETFKEEFRENFKGKHYENCLDKILVKFNERTLKDISAVKTRKLELELTAYKERIKRAEDEVIDIKEDTLKEKERLNKRNQDLEAERIQHLSKIEIISEKMKFLKDNQGEKIESLEEKCKILEKQLEEKENKILKLQDKLENFNDKMLENQSSIVRSSQQFMDAKESMSNENVALKKNLEDLKNQLELK